MIFRKFALLVLALFVLSMTAGCRHTAHGFGQDVEKAGEKIQEKTD
jgi:predicted small secreted protein